jgi:hypothetical protein
MSLPAAGRECDFQKRENHSSERDRGLIFRASAAAEPRFGTTFASAVWGDSVFWRKILYFCGGIVDLPEIG